MPSQVHHLRGNTSHNFLHLQLFLSIYKFPQTISYPLLFNIGCHVLHQVVIGINTTHPQAMYLLEDRPLV